jgi:hypothetical protein
MKQIMWGLLGVAAILWSLLGWFLHALAGSGSAAVVTVTRWLELDPASTQWIADTLALAGGIAQWLVILIWLMGLGLLGALGWLGGRAGDAMEDFSKADSGVDVTTNRPPRGQTIDGSIRDKTLS